MILLNISIVIATFFIMEFVAWFTHKYIMHGLLWVLHEDHHVKTPGFFEKNDSFFLIFAIPSMLLIFTGTLSAFDAKFFIGIGILLYGFAYFTVHEVLIHKRFKWFNKSKNPYFLGLIRAHRRHHSHLSKEDGECFGMLIVPPKYIREARKELQNANN